MPTITPAAPIDQPPTTTASDSEEEDFHEYDKPVVTFEQNGTKVVTVYCENDKGERIRTITKIKITKVKNKVKHQVAERKFLPKFGDAKGAPMGQRDPNTTTFGEVVDLKMGVISETSVEAKDSEEKKTVKSKSISCRICKGDHWTLKCPFKDTMKPADEADDDKESVVSGRDNKFASNKYVPPSLRGAGGGTRGPGESMDNKREEFASLRITNLSEDVQEQDLRELACRFGSISRVFVARGLNNQCKGFAFVSFYNRTEGERCLQALNGFGYDNLILSVEWAK